MPPPLGRELGKGKPVRHSNGRTTVEQFNRDGDVESAQTLERYDLGHWEAMELALALRDRADGMSDRHGDQTAVKDLAALFGVEGVFTVTVMNQTA